LKEQIAEVIYPLEVKIDPGSKITGLAVLSGSKLIWAAEITHRGETIKAALLCRRQIRRGRRARNTRYRPARLLNRAGPKGCDEEIYMSVSRTEDMYEIEVAFQYLASTKDGYFWKDVGECSYNYRHNNIEIGFH
jgi:RRXRR protein